MWFNFGIFKRSSWCHGFYMQSIVFDTTFAYIGRGFFRNNCITNSLNLYCIGPPLLALKTMWHAIFCFATIKAMNWFEKYLLQMFHFLVLMQQIGRLNAMVNQIETVINWRIQTFKIYNWSNCTVCIIESFIFLWNKRKINMW